MKLKLVLSIAILSVSGLFPLFSQNNPPKEANQSSKGNPTQLGQDTSRYWNDRLYVKFKSKAVVKLREFKSTQTRQAALSTDNISNILQKYEATTFRSLPESAQLPSLKATYELKVPKGKAVTSVIRELQNQPEIAYAERVPKHRIFFTPNDPRFPQQYALTKVNASAAYDLVNGGVPTLVAIVDDAVLYTHQDLRYSVDLSRSYDVADKDSDPRPPSSGPNAATTAYFSHGTHTSGIVGATTDNRVGVASIGRNKVRIMGIKCTSDSGDAQFIEHAYEGIVYAIDHGARVVSMSWGGGEFSKTEQALFTAGTARGVLFIAAAGNENSEDNFYPASYDHVLAVASSDQNDLKSSFSNYGRWVDISAPGSDILSTVANGSVGTYTFYSGTSMACPAVASLAGLILSQNPSLTPHLVEQIIKSSADPIDDLNAGYAGKLGAGRMNALKALQAIPAKWNPLIFSISPSVAAPGDTVTIKGIYFKGVYQVSFGNVKARFSVVDCTTISTIVPAGAVTAPIRVMKSSRTGQSYDNFYVGYTMSTASISACGNSFYDPGGVGDYANKVNITQTFSPATPDSKLKFTFTSFDVEAGSDFLYVYDGSSASAALIGVFTGTASPGVITATNPTGQLTFRFISAIGNRPGWTATISCVSGFVPPAALAAEWDRRFGGSNDDILTSSIQTSDGGYLLAGYSESGSDGDKTQDSQGVHDYWVVKIDNDGVKQWDRRFGGSGYDYLTSVIQAGDGGYLLAGYSESGSDGDKTQDSQGFHDYWVVKIDNKGVKQWDRRFGGSGFDQLTLSIQTSDGGYLLAGYSESGSGGDKTQDSWGSTDYWVVKIDTNGSKQWDRRFGGGGYDVLTSVLQTSDGNYLLSGYTYSESGGDKTQDSWGNADYWVVKISTNGVKQWDKRFGGGGYDVLTSAIQTTDGGYLLAGHSESGSGGDKTQDSWGSADYWVVKVDTNGIKQWDKRFGGSGYDILTSAIQTTDGGYLLAGHSESGSGGDKTQDSQGNYDYWVVKTDNKGVKQWDERFGGNSYNYLSSAFLTSDGGYLLAGWSSSGIGGNKTQDSQGNYDYWVVKTYPSSAYVMSNSTTVAACSGTFYDPGYTGNYGDNGTFVQTFSPNTPGSKLKFTFTSFDLQADYDVLSVYDGANTSAPLIGSYTSTFSPGTITASNATGQLTFQFTSNDSLSRAGWTASVACFTDTTTTTMTPPAESARLENESPQEDEETLLTAYPNPFARQVLLSFQLGQSGPAVLDIFDLQGKPVARLYQGEMEAGRRYETEFMAANLQAGLYLARLITARKAKVIKIMLVR